MIDLTRQGEGGILRAEARRWLHSDTESLGYRRDYQSPVEDPPEPVLDLKVEPLDASLAKALFEVPGLDSQNQLYLDRRKTMWEMGFSGGYVAVDPGGRPAYLQFFIPHEQADLAHRHWGDLFPPYGSDTLLVEGAWVPPDFRGKRVMAHGMYLISEAAKQDSPDEVRFAETYVDIGNRGAKLGCVQSGFSVFKRRTESWRFGRHTFRFEDATE
jgi:hypothetical protein